MFDWYRFTLYHITNASRLQDLLIFRLEYFKASQIEKQVAECAQLVCICSKICQKAKIGITIALWLGQTEHSMLFSQRESL
jgi:hypothetical protein